MHFSLNILPVVISVVSAVTLPTASTYCSSSQATTKYPNKCEIFKVFNHLNEGNFTAFFENVAPDVEWTLMGTHPLAGVYHNRTIFIADAIERLANVLKAGGTANLLSIVGGGDEEWSVQEIHALGVCKNGELSNRSLLTMLLLSVDPFVEKQFADQSSTGLKYDNVFSWAMRWSTGRIIVQVRAFFDSHLVARAITENESPEYFYTDQRATLEPGPVGAGCATKS
jgi:ketosteroid isomerase-like protein